MYEIEVREDLHRVRYETGTELFIELIHSGVMGPGDQEFIHLELRSGKNLALFSTVKGGGECRQFVSELQRCLSILDGIE